MDPTFPKETVWSEKYRPRTVDDCVLPPSISAEVKQFLKKEEFPNLLLTGTAGIGKTTVARAIADELGADTLFINASSENGIDVLRTKIQNFASSTSLTGAQKIVILDEADYLNAQSTQPAMRAFMESFSANCRFIFTCNFKNRLISPLHSRCANVEFNAKKSELPKLSATFMNRMCGILDREGMKYNKKILASLIMRYAPDWRRVINECQRFSYNGELSPEVLSASSDSVFEGLIGDLRDKSFKGVRQWVAANVGVDSSQVFRKIYDNVYEYLDPASIPDAVLITSQYQYQDAFVADKEINLTAYFVELMSNCNFKDA